MSSYVDINDEGAARTAADTLISLGQQLQRQDTPEPAVDWGDDVLGTTMKSSYDEGDVPAECRRMRHELGQRLSHVGTGLAKAVKELHRQERDNARDLGAVHPPDL